MRKRRFGSSLRSCWPWIFSGWFWDASCETSLLFWRLMESSYLNLFTFIDTLSNLSLTLSTALQSYTGFTMLACSLSNEDEILVWESLPQNRTTDLTNFSNNHRSTGFFHRIRFFKWSLNFPTLITKKNKLKTPFKITIPWTFYWAITMRWITGTPNRILCWRLKLMNH